MLDTGTGGSQYVADGSYLESYRPVVSGDVVSWTGQSGDLTFAQVSDVGVEITEGDRVRDWAEAGHGSFAIARRKGQATTVELVTPG